MNIYQFNCNEGHVVDPQQANAVLRHKPDVIVFEAPSSKSPSLIYNKYTPSNKPIEKVSEYERMLKKVSKTYPWVASDIHVYENIKKLWSEGHDVKLYNVDGPRELLQTKIGGIKEPEPKQMKRKPQRRGTHLSWWVYVYLREKVMAKHIEKILTQHKNEKILVFLQSFHWVNVRFQLTNPTKKALWKYYFGSFKDLKPKDVSNILGQQNKTLQKYWKKLSDFV